MHCGSFVTRKRQRLKNTIINRNRSCVCNLLTWAFKENYLSNTQVYWSTVEPGFYFLGRNLSLSVCRWMSIQTAPLSSLPLWKPQVCKISILYRCTICFFLETPTHCSWKLKDCFFSPSFLLLFCFSARKLLHKVCLKTNGDVVNEERNTVTINCIIYLFLFF